MEKVLAQPVLLPQAAPGARGPCATDVWGWGKRPIDITHTFSGARQMCHPGNSHGPEAANVFVAQGGGAGRELPSNTPAPPLHRRCFLVAEGAGRNSPLKRVTTVFKILSG